jgi:dethiobiotin synthetase
MSLFITGTGTGVGKTVVTAALAAFLKSRGEDVCVYKPIQTGSPDASQPEDPTQIKTWLGDDVETACSYCFPEPLAPYAADLEKTIRSGKILEDFKALQRKHRIVLVEGAGGVRVPVAKHLEMIDLIRMLQLPVVVVTHPHLGTINHTLLTVEALLTQRLEVKGVVISGAPTDTATHSEPAVRTLLPTLEPFLPVPVLGTLPEIPLTRAGFHAVIPAVEQLKLWE